MASKKFIQDRITGKIREIEKLNAKMERIEKAELTNWEVNPYYYDESDKRHTLKDLETAKAALADWQAQLVKAEEMEASRNIPAITEFLDRWYDNCVEYFLSEKLKYDIALKEWHQVEHEYCNWFNHERFHASKEIRQLREEEYRDTKKKFHSAWSHVTQFNHGSKSWAETMKQDLRDEYNRKYDFIITRTNDIVGQITDASYLTVGAKGDLNGYILGTKGCCSVKTIGAGGDNYNLYVRPALEQQDYNRKMGEQVESLQQTILRQQQQIQQQNRTLNQLQQEGIIPTQPNQTIDTNPNSAQQYFNQQYQQYFNQQNR